MNNIKTQIQERVNNTSGIWARSAEHGQNMYMIFASDFDFDYTMQYLQDNNVDFKNLKGAYVMQSTGEKVIEDSFIINLKYIDKVMDLIQNQESILMLQGVNYDDTRNAQLWYKKGNIEHIGKFTQVSKDEALASDYWTYCPYMDKYWITK